MRTLLLALLLTIPAAHAQVVGAFDLFPPALKQYLGLSDSQTLSLLKLEASYRQVAIQKTARRLEVQAEIALETAKAVPDPMALGLRYAELEAIRRELADGRKDTVTKSQALLTPAQTSKLNVLKQALDLNDTACSAVDHYLLPAPAPGVGAAFASADGIMILSQMVTGSAGPCASQTALLGLSQVTGNPDSAR